MYCDLDHSREEYLFGHLEEKVVAASKLDLPRALCSTFIEHYKTGLFNKDSDCAPPKSVQRLKNRLNSLQVS